MVHALALSLDRDTPLPNAHTIDGNVFGNCRDVKSIICIVYVVVVNGSIDVGGT